MQAIVVLHVLLMVLDQHLFKGFKALFFPHILHQPIMDPAMRILEIHPGLSFITLHCYCRRVISRSCPIQSFAVIW